MYFVDHSVDIICIAIRRLLFSVFVVVSRSSCGKPCVSLLLGATLFVSGEIVQFTKFARFRVD